MSDRLLVTCNGESKELFMSFGMLDEISRVVGDIEQIGLISVDPDIRTKVLKSLLSERDEDGRVKGEFNLMTSNITMDDVNAIIEWTADNVTDFFIKAMQASARVKAKNEARVEALMPKAPASTSSSSGSQS